ncbi:MAG TPA: sulfite exporter TauE/SafE family protein [Candidatus Sulfotelmatobacter sp.]|nr:sulfite exporter TauE/SafE family protein [Candidatus Sulfotelmatobacter sp.]
MAFHFLVTIAAIVAGGIASVAGFGVGSILTPLLATQVGTKLAVAAVSVPHVIATAIRFLLIREHVDRRVFISFGITSALAGLVGALLHTWFRSTVLSYVLGALLLAAGIMGITGFSERLHFEGPAAWVAGALSGGFGGLVGNQGGIRAAAMLGMGVSREAFVATATAIALIVDAVRMPVYAATQARQVLHIWEIVLLAIIGVVIGTLAGARALRRIPRPLFLRIVSAIILVLGVSMLIHPGAG